MAVLTSAVGILAIRAGVDDGGEVLGAGAAPTEAGAPDVPADGSSPEVEPPEVALPAAEPDATTERSSATADSTTSLPERDESVVEDGVIVSSGSRAMLTFDGNRGLEELEWGVYHRNVGLQSAASADADVWGDGNVWHGGTWTGDHDLSCGSPDTQRSLSTELIAGEGEGDDWWKTGVEFRVGELLYVCREHLMTSMGDVDGYSIVWFTPKLVFDAVDSVTFDVNLTDLGNRQWWKVAVVRDEMYRATQVGGIDAIVPAHIRSDVPAANVSTDMNSADGLYVSWSGLGAGYPGGLMIGTDASGFEFANPTPDDKATRHPVSIVDNGDGTVTFTVAGVAHTAPGSFPECPCRVVFYDHNYTPDKNEFGPGVQVGYTWHWDNIVVE